MIEQQIEKGHNIPSYELFMTDKEREIFKDFLRFEPTKKAGGKTESHSEKRYNIEKPGAEEAQFEGIERELALTQELDSLQAEYMDPRLYTHLSDTDIGGPNCMAFAIGRPWQDSAKKIPYEMKPYPGFFCGESNSFDLYDILLGGDYNESKKRLVYLLKSDLDTMGKNLVEVDKDYSCKDGENKICMMGSSEYGDFHFMREGENAWFHKPGLLSVSCFDDSGRLIINPEHCDTIYDMFYGYYVIRNREGEMTDGKQS